MSEREYPDVGLDGMADDTPMPQAAATLLAHLATKDAQANRADPAARQPVQITEGYSVTWECPDGMVGLWSCWLRDQLYLGYPSPWATVTDEQLQASFDLTADDHRPRLREDYGRHVGHWTVPLGDEQHIALCVDEHASHLHHFKAIDGPCERMHAADYGWGGDEDGRLYDGSYDAERDRGKRVLSEPFWRPTGIEPSAWPMPSDDPFRRAQGLLYTRLEPGFLALGCDLANAHGCSGVTVEMNSGLTIDPRNLSAMGYEVQWLKGQVGTRAGWGADVVYGVRDDEEVMLVSANSMVPWVCYRRRPVSGPVTEAMIRELLHF